MAKIDKIKETITTIRDEIKNYFVIFMALITSSFTIFYQVLIKSIHPTMLLIGVGSLILSLFALLIIKKRRSELDNLIDELEEL